MGWASSVVSTGLSVPAYTAISVSFASGFREKAFCPEGVVVVEWGVSVGVESGVSSDCAVTALKFVSV